MTAQLCIEFNRLNYPALPNFAIHLTIAYSCNHLYYVFIVFSLSCLFFSIKTVNWKKEFRMDHVVRHWVKLGTGRPPSLTQPALCDTRGSRCSHLITPYKWTTPFLTSNLTYP
jgi:hypothetical protein